jgi:hypothetical protein
MVGLTLPGWLLADCLAWLVALASLLIWSSSGLVSVAWLRAAREGRRAGVSPPAGPSRVTVAPRSVGRSRDGPARSGARGKFGGDLHQHRAEEVTKSRGLSSTRTRSPVESLLSSHHPASADARAETARTGAARTERSEGRGAQRPCARRGPGYAWLRRRGRDEMMPQRSRTWMHSLSAVRIMWAVPGPPRS